MAEPPRWERRQEERPVFIHYHNQRLDGEPQTDVSNEHPSGPASWAPAADPSSCHILPPALGFGSNICQPLGYFLKRSTGRQGASDSQQDGLLKGHTPFPTGTHLSMVQKLSEWVVGRGRASVSTMRVGCHPAGKTRQSGESAGDGPRLFQPRRALGPGPPVPLGSGTVLGQSLPVSSQPQHRTASYFSHLPKSLSLPLLASSAASFLPPLDSRASSKSKPPPHLSANRPPALSKQAFPATDSLKLL